MAAAGAPAVMGCAWTRSALSPQSTTQPVVEVPPTRVAAAPEPEALPPDDATLTAIEGFLARTADFAIPHAEGRDTSASPMVRPAATAAGGSPIETTPRGAVAEDRVAANTQLALPDSATRSTPVEAPVLTGVSIRKPSPPAIPATLEPESPNAPATAAATTGAFSWDRVIQQLDADAESKRDFRSVWAAILGRVALGRNTDGLTAERDLPSPTRDVLSLLTRALPRVYDVLASGDASATPALHAVEELRVALSERAELDVSNVELCRKVLTFGAYDTLEEADLVAGRALPAIVYCEIRNFQSEQDADNRYVTRLSTRVEVFTADGSSVLEKSEPEIVDTCRTRRSDFFLAQRITLPNVTPAGEYVLKVTVEDLRGMKIGEGRKPFTLSPKTPIVQGR